MELYSLYNFCSSWLFQAIAHLYFLFLAIELISLIKSKDKYDTYFLDIICFNSSSFKSSAICVSLVSIILSFFILFSNNQFIIFFGCKDIRVMPEGTYCYYVYATNKKGKTYTLPAKITKINDTYVEEDGERTETRTNSYYYVENVFFDNGGYLYFDSDYFEYGEENYATDQNGKGWDIEITNHKTFHEKVTETKPFKPASLIMPLLEILTIATSTILYILIIRKRKIFK